MNRSLPFLLVGGFLVVLLIVLLWGSMTTTIDFGQKGVIFRTFGGGIDKKKIFNQGFHFIAPWNKIFKYDVKIQENNTTMEVLSKNGLTIKVDVSYWYKPKEDRLPLLHDEVGPNYHEKIVNPAIRSATREVIGKYLPEELYSTKREVIEDEIMNRTRKSIADKHILLDDVLIRDVTLPLSLQEAIEKKLKQEQIALEYEFRLEAAQKEAERLRIEARGKAEAYDIINRSLTEKILQEKGIEATLKLAESPNSKIVIIGNSKNGLPVILGDNKQ